LALAGMMRDEFRIILTLKIIGFLLLTMKTFA